MKTMGYWIVLLFLSCIHLKGSLGSDPCADGTYPEGKMFLYKNGCFPYYYQCVHGKSFQRPCAPGTVFDPSIGVCNHPQNVPGCGDSNACHGHSHGDLYLPEEGCFPYFYQCVHGTAYKMPCPDGLVFDTTLDVCNWPSDVQGCAGGNGGCNGHSHGDLYVDDENGCYSFFYQCVHGNPVQKTCPDGLVFDTSLSVCQWPASVPGCSSDFNGCHGHSHGDLYLPDAGCYSFFYQCVHGKGYKMPCPEGLVFDTNLDVCNWPSEVKGCEGNTKPATTEAASSSTTTATTTSPAALVTEQPPMLEGKTYVAFVVDSTGSMSTEISSVKEWLKDCIHGSNFVCGWAPTGGWIVSSFNDPDSKLEVGPTTDINEAVSAIDGLQPRGGWDCPEMALGGMIKAVEVVPDNNAGCKVFFFSDASPKDLDKTAEVSKLFFQKRCAFIPILTSCCGKCHWPCLSVNPEYCSNHVIEKTHTLRRKRSTDNDDVPESFYYWLSEKTGGNTYIIDKPEATRTLLTLLEKSVTLGFCESNERAGPKGKGYKCAADCAVKGMCWDSGVNQCFCTSAECARGAIHEDSSRCDDDYLIYCDPKISQDFFADPKSCNGFFTCKLGKLEHFECPSGKLYTPDRADHCDYPESVPGPCKGRRVSPKNEQ